MDKPSRIFVSDIHFGAGEKYDWFKPERHGKHIEAMTDWINENAGRIKDVILLGDVFDTWVCPCHKRPPTIREIIDANREHLSMIAKIKPSVDIYYVNGNHDMHVTPADIDAAFGRGRVRCVQNYKAGLLYAEHGHRFGMFNSWDKMHDPAHKLPLGYYITRVVTSSKKKYDSPGAMLSFADDALEAAFTTQTIAESVMEGLMEMANLTPDDYVVMPAGWRDITLGDVQDRYAGLFDRWVERFGYRRAVHAVMAEADYLNWFADRECSSQGYKVFVMGHSHKAELDKDVATLSGRRVYANSGYLCTGQPTFVEVEKFSGNKYQVTPWRIQKGTPQAKPKVIV